MKKFIIDGIELGPWDVDLWGYFRILSGCGFTNLFVTINSHRNDLVIDSNLTNYTYSFYFPDRSMKAFENNIKYSTQDEAKMAADLSIEKWMKLKAFI